MLSLLSILVRPPSKLPNPFLSSALILTMVSFVRKLSAENTPKLPRPKLVGSFTAIGFRQSPGTVPSEAITVILLLVLLNPPNLGAFEQFLFLPRCNYTEVRRRKLPGPLPFVSTRNVLLA